MFLIRKSKKAEACIEICLSKKRQVYLHLGLA